MRNLCLNQGTFVGKLGWRFRSLTLRVQLSFRVFLTEITDVVFGLHNGDEGRLHIFLGQLLQVDLFEPGVFLHFLWALASQPEVLFLAEQGVQKSLQIFRDMFWVDWLRKLDLIELVVAILAVKGWDSDE